MRHAELQKTGQHGKRKRPIDLEIDDSSVEEETSPVVRDLNEEELATYAAHYSQHGGDHTYVQLQKLQPQFVDEAAMIKEQKINATDYVIDTSSFEEGTVAIVRGMIESESVAYSQYENDLTYSKLQKLQRQFIDEAIMMIELKMGPAEAAVAAYNFQQKFESTVNSSRCLSEEVKQHLLQNAPQIAAQHLKMKKERTQLKAQQQALEQQAQQTSKVFPQPEEVDEPMDRNRRNAANIRRRLKSKFLRQREETINKEVIDEFLGK